MSLSSILSKARKRGKQGKAYQGKGKRYDTAEGYRYVYDDPKGSAGTAREAVDEAMDGAERTPEGKPPGWKETYKDGEWREEKGGWSFNKQTNSYQRRTRGGWEHWTPTPQLMAPPAPIQDLMTNDLDTAVRRQKEHGVPIIASLGLGVDSTAFLVGLVERGIRPDAILFADTGGERSKITDGELEAGRIDTYGMLPVLDQWLVENGMPGITVLRKVPTVHGKSEIEYYSLETECYAGVTKPSIAFGGGRRCSAKWKKDVQNKWADMFFEDAKSAWEQGFQVTKLIGYSADEADSRRPSIADDSQYTYVYPLREWGWNREDSKNAIREAGLPVPVKSACYFCPVTRPHELRNIVESHNDAGRRIVEMELMSAPNDKKIDGLWGANPTKGYRGATKKPTSMTEMIVGEELLPEFEGIGREMAPPWWLAEGPVDNPPRDFSLKDENLREQIYGLLRPTQPMPPRDLPGLVMIGESRNKVQREKRERAAAEDAMQQDLFAMSFFEDTLDLVKSHWLESIGLRKAKDTPAELSERVKGSRKNKKGSAASAFGSIEFSEATVDALKNKVKQHNDSSEKKVTLRQLKAVYRRGSGAFSQSHHPKANRHSWSMGRVNSFLRRLKGGDGHSQDDDLIKRQGGQHKYIRRLGGPGNYTYVYKEATGRKVKQVQEESTKHQKLYDTYDELMDFAERDPGIFKIPNVREEFTPEQQVVMDALTLFTQGHVAAVRNPEKHIAGHNRIIPGKGTYSVPSNKVARKDYERAHAVIKALCERPARENYLGPGVTNEPVYRGARLTHETVTALLETPDLAFDFSVVGSFSTEYNMAKHFAGMRVAESGSTRDVRGKKSNFVPVVFVLEEPQTGSNIDFLSGVEGEKEFITGGTMRITRIEKGYQPLNAERFKRQGPNSYDALSRPIHIYVEQVMQKALQMLPSHILDELDREFDERPKPLQKGIFSQLLKARAHKYVRRTPTGDPKRPWRYYYSEAAVARSAQAGETIRVKGHTLEVLSVDQDKLEVEWDGKKIVLSHDEWAERIREVAGESFVRAAEKKARQHANAILRHVPRKLLAELEGDTDAMRMADLRVRAPDVYRRLAKAFRRAGISALDAQRAIRFTLARKGWVPDARATFLGSMMKPGTAWVASQYKTVAFQAERIAQSGTAPLDDVEIRPEHVAAALELPRTKRAVDKVIANAESELERLRKLMTRPRAGPRKPKPEQQSLDIDVPSEAIAQAMASEALAKLRFLVKAYPEMALNQTALAEIGALNEIQAAAPAQEPRTKGAECMLFIAGEGGQAQQLKARYELREAKSVRPSHIPWEGFAENAAYPEGLQTRPYHTDKQLQQGVRDNAGLSPDRTPQPAFWVNTNPDSVNGPPMILDDGTVLGGNSRAMSQQVIFTDEKLAGGEHDQRLREYLKDQAGQFGFTAEDVEALEHPMLVRVVEPADTGDANLKLLVQQMNENFTKGLDPRAMQVALGRRIDEGVLRALASEMDADETIDAFLDSKTLNEDGSPRNKAFLDQLRKVGLIDDRNANQYYKPGDGGGLSSQLNEDGKRLVSRVLLGHIVDDVDLLSGTPPEMVKTIAKSVPYFIQAGAGDPDYQIKDALKHALHSYNEFVSRKLNPKSTRDQELINRRITTFFSQLKADLTDPKSGDQVFEPQPVETDPLVRQIFEALIRRPGPSQLSWVMQNYMEQVDKEANAAKDMFREKPTAAEFMEMALTSAIDKAAKNAEIRAAQKKADKEYKARAKEIQEAMKREQASKDGPERDTATMSMFG